MGRGLQYNEQPEFFTHVASMSEMHDKGQTVLSGPWIRKARGLDGELDNGGMTIFKAADMEEALKIANDDSTVRSGMPDVEVKMIWAPFHQRAPDLGLRAWIGSASRGEDAATRWSGLGGGAGARATQDERPMAEIHGQLAKRGRLPRQFERERSGRDERSVGKHRL